MQTYAAVFAIGLLLAIILTPVVIALGKRWGIVDVPGKRRVHEGAIPRIGGLAIACGGMLGVAPVFLLDNTIGAAFWQAWEPLHALIVASMGVFLLGLVDDLRGVPAWGKLLVEIGLSLYVVLSGVRIEVIEFLPGHVVQFGWLSTPLTVLWIVGVTNAVNMIDGLDGLAGGVSAIALAVISGLALARGDTIMATLMLAHLGAVVGFLVFNFNPAKVFMGDCGSLYLGFFLGAASALTGHKTSTLVGLGLPALALGVPLTDTSFAIVRRLYRRQPLFSPDKGHIHHRVLRSARTHRQAVLAIYGIAAGATAIGSLAVVVRNDEAALLVLVGAALFLFLGVFLAAGGMRYASGRRNGERGVELLRDALKDGGEVCVDLTDREMNAYIRRILREMVGRDRKFVLVARRRNGSEEWIIREGSGEGGNERPGG